MHGVASCDVLVQCLTVRASQYTSGNKQWQNVRQGMPAGMADMCKEP